MYEQARRDWAAFEPTAIPSKAVVPQLQRWLAELPAGARVLDVGCGAGAIAEHLVALGFSVVGIDINAAAVTRLRREIPQAKFQTCDVARAGGFGLEEPAFDAVVCQLVASVVGDARDRATLLQNIHAVLRPSGALFISFSGLSDDLNDEYAQLYARDAAASGERGSYFSRDAAGEVLYRTHHFSGEEIAALLEEQGFGTIRSEVVIEASSRRPEQRARFYYVSCWVARAGTMGHSASESKNLSPGG